MSWSWYKVEPLDVLYLRGNRLFDGGGADATALMPPWPSVFAGALRSALLFASGARRLKQLEGPVAEVLGTFSEPGSFRIAHVSLARDAAGGAELIYPLPADLVVTDSAEAEDGALNVQRVLPQVGLGQFGLVTSYPLGGLPVLRQGSLAKPKSGYWLRAEGWRRYQHGEVVRVEDLIHQRELWRADPRLGIALDAQTGTVQEGLLYTTETVDLADGVGFAVAVAGLNIEAQTLLESAACRLLRLGGDGRGAELTPLPIAVPAPPWERIATAGRFGLVALTPVLSEQGWLPPGTVREGQEPVWHWGSLRARVTSAVIGRHEIISGWDLANHRPKPAQRVVPAGSLWWFELLKGGVDALHELLAEGLWPEFTRTALGPTWRQRRAEGFNNVAVVCTPNETNGKG